MLRRFLLFNWFCCFNLGYFGLGCFGTLVILTWVFWDFVYFGLGYFGFGYFGVEPLIRKATGWLCLLPKQVLQRGRKLRPKIE